MVEHVEADGVRVQIGAAEQKRSRPKIPWDRINGHWPGRAEYDRRNRP